jgi:three-Cys-motif partner protein
MFLWVSRMAVSPQEFGSAHTEAKLQAVEKYLNRFTTALKGKFTLIYVDAFAGSGASIAKRDKNQMQLIETDDIVDGSARRALRTSPSFDQFLFIEKMARNVRSLEGLKDEFPEHAAIIKIVPGDANTELRDFATKLNRRDARAVVFIDPFGLSLEWDTIAALGNTQRVDLWYLVPTGGMSRQIKLDGSELESATLLDKVLGTPDWRGRIISSSISTDMFGMPVESTTKIGGAQELSDFVKERLSTVFAGGVSTKSLPLGRGGRHEFSLVFACANPSERASSLALRLADAVLKL